MFWRIILYIYICVSVLNLIMTICMISDGLKIINSKYPERKTIKSKRGGLISSIIRIIFIAFVPLFNVIVLFGIMTDYDSMLDEVIKNTEEKIEK